MISKQKNPADQARSHPEDTTTCSAKDQTLLSRLPFLIAYPLQKMALSPSHGTKLPALIHAIFQFLRYTGIVLLSDYLQSPLRNKLINNQICELRRPTVGKWLGFINSVARNYERTGQEFFMRDFLGDWGKASHMTMHSYCQGAIHRIVREGKSKSVIDAGVELRNLYQHFSLPPEESVAREVVDLYAPHFLSVLEACTFFTHCRLMLVTEIGADSLHGRLLIGPDETRFPESTIGIAPPCPRPHNVLLVDCKDSRRLPLHPIAIRYFCDTESDGVIQGEPYHLFEGNTSRSIVYFSMYTKQRDVRHFEAFRQKLEAKEIDSIFLNRDSLRPWVLLDYARDVSQDTLNSYKGAKYFPSLYVRRDLEEQVIAGFLDSPKPGLLLCGDAGVGKTSLLCHFVEKSLQEQEETEHGLAGLPMKKPRQDIVLFVNLGTRFRPSPDNDGLFHMLRRSLCMSPGEIRGFGEFCAILDACRKDDEFDRQLILVIDAVNESLDMLAALFELQEMLETALRYPFVKLIFSMRTRSLESLRARCQALYGRNLNLLNDQRLLFAPEQSPHNAVVLPPFNERQLELFLGKMPASQNAPGEEASLARIGLETLTPQLRKIISNPLLASMYMRTADAAPMPGHLTVHLLFRRFHEHVIRNDPGLGPALAVLVDHALAHRQNSFEEADVHELLEATIRGPRRFAPYELPRPSLLDRLLEEGICMEAPEEGPHKIVRSWRIRFSHEKHMEHLIADALGRQHPEPGAAGLLKLANDDSFQRELPEYDGAVSLLLAEHLEQLAGSQAFWDGLRPDRYSLVLEAAKIAEDRIAAQPRDRNGIAARLVQALARKPCADMINLILGIAGNLEYDYRWPAADFLYRRILEILERSPAGMEERLWRLHSGLSRFAWKNLKSRECIAHAEAALPHAQDAIQRVQSLADQALGLHDLGCRHDDPEFFRQALDLLRTAETEASRDTNAQALLPMLCNRLGLNAFELGNWHGRQGHKGELVSWHGTAQEYYHKGLDMEQARRTKQESGKLLHNLGRLLAAQGDHHRALAAFESAYAESAAIQDLFVLSLTIYAIAREHRDLGNQNEVIRWCRKNEVLQERFGVVRDMQNTYQLLAEAYFQIDQYHEAIRYFQARAESRAMDEAEQDIHHFSLGRCFSYADQPDQAHAHFRFCYDYNIRHGLHERQLPVIQHLVTACRELNRHDEVADIFLRYHETFQNAPGFLIIQFLYFQSQGDPATSDELLRRITEEHCEELIFAETDVSQVLASKGLGSDKQARSLIGQLNRAVALSMAGDARASWPCFESALSSLAASHLFAVIEPSLDVFTQVAVKLDDQGREACDALFETMICTLYDADEYEHLHAFCSRYIRFLDMTGKRAKIPTVMILVLRQVWINDQDRYAEYAITFARLLKDFIAKHCAQPHGEPTFWERIELFRNRLGNDKAFAGYVRLLEYLYRDKMTINLDRVDLPEVFKQIIWQETGDDFTE